VSLHEPKRATPYLFSPPVCRCVRRPASDAFVFFDRNSNCKGDASASRGSHPDELLLVNNVQEWRQAVNDAGASFEVRRKLLLLSLLTYVFVVLELTRLTPTGIFPLWQGWPHSPLLPRVCSS